MKQGPPGNDLCHKNELRHVTDQDDSTDSTRSARRLDDINDNTEVGVARDINASSAGPEMSINNAIVGSPLSSRESSYSRSTPMMKAWLKKLNKKHIFGVTLLLIVNVIWVGSAALTQFLFDQQNYDKPLFTMYFKTALFVIYLLPFTFWRPWQRLCCHRSSLRKKTESAKQQTIRNEDKEEDGSINNSIITNSQTASSQYGTFSPIPSTNTITDDEEADLVKQNGDFSITLSSDYVDSSLLSSSQDEEDNKPILGPSRFIPTKFNDDGKYDTNSLTLPRKMMESKTNYLTSSTTNLLSKSTRANVRFCRTVEVKSVPDQHPTRRLNGDNPTLLNSSHSRQIIPTIPVKIVFVLALVFGIFWFFANYLYAKALETQSVAAVNTLSSLCSVFVLVLAAIPFPQLADRDRFNLTKLLLIAISVAGAVLIGFSPSSDKMGGVSVGVLFSLGGCALYALYLVLLSKFLPHPESLEIPMFFGFVGLVDGLIFIPVVWVWDYLGIEKFELPPTYEAWTVLLVNGFIGTVLSELLWLWGCLLTSSVVGTLSISLVTPLSIAYNIVFTHLKFSVEFLAGAGIVVLVFVLVTLLDYYGNGSDPILTCTKKIWHWFTEHSHRSCDGYNKLCDESKDLLSNNYADRPMAEGSPPPIS